MFERGRVDTSEHCAVPVEITTDSGDALTGRLLIAGGRSLVELLNSNVSFLEFEPYGGDRIFFAKSALRNVKLINAGRAPDLGPRARDLDGFDPFTILGITRTASFAEARTAFHALSRLYHPDRYAQADLPNEVREYLAAMARKINAAFAALETADKARNKRAPSDRVVAVHTSGTRF